MSEKIIKAGVIGWPVAHSLSPIIHNYWLKKYGINGSYERIPVRPEELEDKLKELADSGYAGVNVTIPHKERVMEFVEPNPLINVIGATNTLTFRNNRIEGENTDIIGFYGLLNIIRTQDKDWHKAASSQKRSKKAMVIGAGGAARSVIYAMLGPPFQEVIIANRNIERAEKIKEDFNYWPESILKICNWDEMQKILPSADILVNATSLGMKGQPTLEIDIGNFNKKGWVVDIVYNPLQTELLKQAEELDIKNLGGLDMLIEQAAPGFVKWFQPKEYPQATPELRQLLIRELEKECS